MADYLSPAKVGSFDYLAPAIAPAISAGTVPVRFDFPASYAILSTVVEQPSDITSVKVTPTSAAVKGGSSQQFSVAVVGGSGANLDVVWTATAGVISQTGAFNAPQATNADQIIKVRSTSVQDSKKWDEATVTVAALPTVSGVAVTPLGVELAGGAQFQFSASVQGTNEPSQAVDWSTTLGEISDTGTVTAPNIIGVNQIGTVTATSRLDPTVSKSVTFIVLAVAVDLDPVGAPVSRFARPVRDISRGGWLPSSGTNLYAMVDDAGAEDGDYISTNGSEPCEMALQPVRDPNTSSNQVVRYWAHSPAGAPLIVELRQGAVLIASWTHDTLPSTSTRFEQTLTSAQCDSITNYADLRVKLVAA
jgi:hypothetical protein